jgi:site-specific recombinase XerD
MKLSEGIRIYVEQRQSTGISFAKGSKTYEAFLRDAGNLPIGEVQVQHVAQFLDQPHSSSMAIRRKYSLLRHFFEYWSAHGLIGEAPMPPNQSRKRSTFLPYIYTREELRRVIRLASQLALPKDAIDSRTLRAALLTIYATGATVGEVTNLLKDDVNLHDETIRFSSSHLKLQRNIPICKDLARVLRRYSVSQEGTGPSSDYFFSRVSGAVITPRRLLAYFERLRGAAKIAGYRNSSKRPCLRDLRATFAVHQIESWLKKGENLDRMLPALGAYMGNVGLEAAERYLQLAPEHFKQALNKLSPGGSGVRWRNDPAYSEFLSTL